MKNTSSFIKQSSINNVLTSLEIETFSASIIQKCILICDEHFIDGNTNQHGVYSKDPGVAFTNFFFPPTNGKKQSKTNLYKVLKDCGIELSHSEEVEEFVALIVDKCKSIVDSKFIDASYDKNQENFGKNDPRFGREQYALDSYYNCDVGSAIEKHFDCPLVIEVKKKKRTI